MITKLSIEQIPAALDILFAKMDNIQSLIQQAIELKRPDADEILNVKEAAKLVHLSVPTIYKMVESRQIPHSKPGGKIYFSKIELTDWAKSRRRKTNAEIEKEAKQYVGKKRGGAKC